MKLLVRSLAILCCIGALALAGCGSGSSSSSSAAAGTASSATSAGTATSSTELPTVKFLLHAGLAFGAFHHWIYKPIKSGVLQHPFSHKLTLVKAGLAALFVYHELKIAVQDAKASKVLRPVVAPLEAAANKLNALKASITGGSVNPSDLTGVNSQLSQAAQTAKSAGQSITETVPSLSQLTAGAH
jgi:hypothetical protein